MAPSFRLSDAEHHGIVDGQLSSGQRAEVLRRATDSSCDRERIATFQEQTDLLRGSFRSVVGEGVPSELNLVMPLQARGITAIEVQSVGLAATRLGGRRRRAWGRVGGLLLTSILVAGGLTGAWILGMSPSPEMAGSRPSEAVMAQRTLTALAAYRKPLEAAAMPTTKIPDLTVGGFAFDGAESRAGRVTAILFRYRNAAAEQVFVAVARAADDGVTPPQGESGVLAWHGKAKAYAISGTLPSERLRLIASAVREQTD